MKTKTLAGRVYLKAAEYLGTGYPTYSCNAVLLASQELQTRALGEYQNVMDARSYRKEMDPDFDGFSNSPLYVGDFMGYSAETAVPDDEARDHRILAVLFMYAIAEAGDLYEFGP